MKRFRAVRIDVLKQRYVEGCTREKTNNQYMPLPGAVFGAAYYKSSSLFQGFNRITHKTERMYMQGTNDTMFALMS